MSRGRGGNALTLDLNMIPKRGYPCPLSMAAFTELIESTLSVTRTDRRSPELVTFLALSSVTHTSIQDEFALGGSRVDGRWRGGVMSIRHVSIQDLLAYLMD